MTAPAISRNTRLFSGAYKGWVLFLIFLASAVNYADRAIMGVVGPALKLELHLSDTQLGLLGGTGFALFYVFMGLPLARLAERFNRVWILSVILVVWSGVTMLCGTARSFMQLFLFRMGVGVGESGATPTTLSLIGDYFPPERRASAVSVWSFGNGMGVFFGVLAGGWLTQHYGWRWAFAAVGTPGLLLAIVVRLTMIEPPRGNSDATRSVGDSPSFLHASRLLFSKPAFVHIAVAGGIANFAIQGIALFAVSYYVRQFHVQLATAAFVVGILNGVAVAFGTLGGGVLSDWAGRHDKRWYAWVPAIVVALAAPLYAIGFLQTSWLAVAAWVALGGAVLYLFHAPYVALALNLAPPTSRATAAAILVLFAASIGLGVGPLGVGWLSDTFAGHLFAQGSTAFAALCAHGVAGGGARAANACLAASARGLQDALVTTSFLFVWAAVHFLMASRHVERDLGGHAH